MRELTYDEVDEISGAFLANVGMGIAGMMGGMSAYALAGGIDGNLSGAGFAGSAVGGFIYGASGFNPAAGIAGTAIGAGVKSGLEKDDS